MSKKKKRRSHSPSSSRTQSQASALADETRQANKRLKPAARNLLLLGLVFLAVVQLLYDGQLISQTATAVFTIVCIAILVLSLWVQFGSGSSGDSRSRLK